MRWLRNIIYSFSVQLLMVHLMRHQLYLLIWLLLFLTIFGVFGSTFGVPYLFLDPEYLGQVAPWSFALMGVALGVFIVTYQVTSYILNSNRFPFLATLEYPFFTYFINNAIIPLGFLVCYLILLYRFQIQAELSTHLQVWINLGSLVAGVILTSLFLLTYFFSRNTNLEGIVKKLKKRGEEVEHHIHMKKELDWESVQRMSRVWPVENFITRKFGIRPVRGVEHYDEKLLLSVFRQHHLNVFIFQILVVVLLVALGFLMEYEAFIIPAAASILLMNSVIVMFVGAFGYWTRGWKFLAFLLLIGLVSLLFYLGMFDYRNKAYGLNYETNHPAYTARALAEANRPQLVQEDMDNTRQILNNWLHKQWRAGRSKPKMVIVTTSGGGHRAALWTMSVLQHMDSVLQGRVMEQTTLFSGASGGMIGSAFFRELYHHHQITDTVNPQNPVYARQLVKDLLNPMIFAITVNDLFFPWRKFKRDGHTYYKDRAYLFEKYLNQNTSGFLDKPLSAYRELEREAKIPMLILSPTIINDERKLFISPHPVRYLTRPGLDTVSYFLGGVDGLDFGTFFDSLGSYKLNFITALRMNATYPYILPNVYLPSEPPIEIMDAGIRDNFGVETSIRFINTFRQWIKANTSGVVLISINSVNREMLGDPTYNRTILTKIFNPVGNLYTNWVQIQQFNQNYMIELSSRLLDGKLEFIEFNYTPGKEEKAASMSFRLTTREKQNILNAVRLIPNQESMERLKRALN